MVRKRFVAEMARRFRKLKAHVKEFVAELDALGLEEKKNPFITLASPREFQFRTDAGKLTAFQEWFAQQVKADIFSVPAGTATNQPWTSRYVESAYKQGQINAYLASRSALDSTDPKYIDQTQAEFLRQSFNQPETISKVQLLATRSYEDLKGVTSQMGSNMNRILSQGMIDGVGPTEIAKEMADNIDSLTNTRALLIARTETIFAHAEGQLDAFERLGVTELGVKAEWSTAGDDRVCEECADMEGKVFDAEDAHGLIPLHPNCRCAWIPAAAEAQKEEERPTPEPAPVGSFEGLTPYSPEWFAELNAKMSEEMKSQPLPKMDLRVEAIEKVKQWDVDEGGLARNRLRILEQGAEKVDLIDLNAISQFGKDEIVNVKDIWATQIGLKPNKVISIIEQGLVEKRVGNEILAVRFGDKLVVVDGNHRAVAALLTEQKQISMRVLNPADLVAKEVVKEAAPATIERYGVGHLTDAADKLIKTEGKTAEELQVMWRDLHAKGIEMPFSVSSIADFQKEFGMSPTSFRDTLFKGLESHDFKLEIKKGGRGSWTIKGNSKDISFTRIWDGKKEVNNSYFHIQEGQKGGLAKILNGNQLKVWDHLGVEKIVLDANIDVGGYAWARYGFTPKDQQEWDWLKASVGNRFVSQSELAAERIRRADAAYIPKSNMPVSDETKAALDRILASKDPEAIRELAALKEEVMPIKGFAFGEVFVKGEPISVGKAALLGSRWSGELDLTSASDYTILRNYMAQRR
jgi:SPP1 gp7 family putative phage head morphogenesis protein